MALRSLQELNHDFAKKNLTHELSATEPRMKTLSPAIMGENRTFTAVLNILIYTIMAMLLLTLMVFRTGAGTSNTFLGHSCFAVMSNSMQDEIPKGSLIVVKQTDPQSIKTGDNITFLRNRTTFVTHKVIEIHENYNGSGTRGFSTMGVNNTNPDPEIVCADNVIGAVSFFIPALGFALSCIADNIWIIWLLLCGIATAIAVRKFFMKTIKQSAGEKIPEGEKVCSALTS